MKRTLITATMIITTLITAAGQSQDPGEISLTWNEIRQLCEKYDNGTDSAYRILNEQLAVTRRDPVANAIWHSCMGQFLSEYCDGNHYRISERTQLAEETPADFKEWDLKTFQRRVREEYLASLENAQMLQAVDAKGYSELLYNKSDNKPYIRTLYEALAYRALTWFSSQLRNERADLSLAGDALWHNDQFLKMPLHITENSTMMQTVLSIYQELTRHYQTQGQEMELILLTIDRYDFMRNQGFAPDNSMDWYISFLEKWAKECESMQGYGLIAYRIGSLYLDQYQDLIGNGEGHWEDQHRDILLKAEFWLKVAINASGKSFYRDDVDKTLRDLHGRTVIAYQLTGDQMVSPTGEPTLWRVKYVNCKQLYVWVVKATPASMQLPQNKRFAFLTAQKHVYDEIVELPDNQDMMTHAGLYLLPKLPAGAYWFVVSDQPQEKWDKNTPRECNLFQVSDIKLLPRSVENGLEVLAVHRKTGRCPMPR